MVIASEKKFSFYCQDAIELSNVPLLTFQLQWSTRTTPSDDYTFTGARVRSRGNRWYKGVLEKTERRWSACLEGASPGTLSARLWITWLLEWSWRDKELVRKDWWLDHILWVAQWPWEWRIWWGTTSCWAYCPSMILSVAIITVYARCRKERRWSSQHQLPHTSLNFYVVVRTSFMLCILWTPHGV